MSRSCALELARERFFALWASVHALGMIASIGLAAAARAPWLLGVASAVSLSVLVARSRPWWTPDGRFGLPNVVTTARLLGTSVLLVAHTTWSPARLAAVALFILLLDAVDGWLARRSGQSSEFGARYDVEVDAVFTAALPVLLWNRGITGAWVLIAGLWRYVYVAAPLLFPVTTREAARSRFGRSVYVLMIASFALALVATPSLGSTAAALGTVAVSVSFMLSFWQRYRPGTAP